MNVYHLTISGEGFRLSDGGSSFDAGFVRNIYTIASNERTAAEKSKIRVIRDLQAKSGVLIGDSSSIKLTIDDVHTIGNWLLIFRREGFVFFPIGKP